MKKKLLYLLLLVSGIASAQDVFFFDAAFKNKILQASTSNTIALDLAGNPMIVDANADGEVQNSEALLVGTLDVSGSEISNITGLQAFVNLTSFTCNNNFINSLSVPLPNLTYLSARSNHMTTIDFTNFPNLTYLDIRFMLFLDNLDVSMLSNLQTMYLQALNVDTVDVSMLANLEFLSIGNGVVNLDVAGLSNLQTLLCVGAPMTTLNISGLTGLTTLDISDTGLADINISSLTTLTSLNCNNSNRTVLDVTAFSNLTSLKCAGNHIVTLDVSSLPNLVTLECHHNELTALDVTMLDNLATLECSGNHLTTLDLSNKPSLVGVNCWGNELTTLDISGSVNIVSLNCNDNQLTALDLSGMANMEWLEMDNNAIATINTDDMVNLTTLSVVGTDIAALDLSMLPSFSALHAMYMDNLISINLKNGYSDASQPEMFSIVDNPNLAFVCVDEDELLWITSHLAGAGSGATVSTYCSFTPGGDYNTITGVMTFDANNDGCDTSDALHHFIKVEINDGTTTGATFSNVSGEYTFYTGAGDFTVTPQFENDWFATTPATVNFPDTNNNIATEDFCITPVGVHNDVEVVMVPVVGARPGFDAEYKVVYKNKGNQVVSGSVTCGWDYSVLTGVTITPMPDVVVPGTYTWNYSNLLPFEDREILMTLHVNSPTDTPAVNDGDILPFTANVISAGTDETPLDNQFAFDQVVVNSLDPNNIMCIQGETAPIEAIGDYLHYVVNFENTGTAPATFVVVKHQINETDFDISSLQILNSSHAVQARVVGNKVEFIFNNINLAALDHGNILFKLKSLSTLGEGDNVVNKANIFFDYNYPLETNEANTVFEKILGTGEFVIDNSIKVYPNPAESIITIEANGNLQSVSLYDIQGRVLQTALLNERSTVLDVSARQSGMYFLKVTTDEGVKVEKIIKK